MRASELEPPRAGPTGPTGLTGLTGPTGPTGPTGMTWLTRYATPLAVGALTLFVLVLRFSQLHQSLYGDEVWTLQDITGRSLGQVIGTVNTGAENSPPLFFVLAWLTAKLGDPTVWIRLPSLLAGAATVPLVYVLGRDVFGRRAGLIAAAIYAFGPFSVYYGIEARPYATMAFFVALSTFALLRAVRAHKWGWWLLYALAATAAAYCHYTAIFVLTVQGAWSLWKCRRRPAPPLLAAALAIVLYLPWVGNIRGKALAVIGALEPLNLHDVLTDLPRPLTGYPYASLHAIPGIVGLPVVVAAAAYGLHRATPRVAAAADPSRALLVALALATPVGLLLYSLLFTDLWIARGLYASLPAQTIVLGGLLSAALGRGRGARSALGGVALAAVLVTLLVGSIRAISPRYARPPFREVAAYIDRTGGPEDPLIMYPSIVDLAIPAQFHRHHPVRDISPRAWRGVPAGGKAFAVVDDYTDVRYHVGIPRPAGFRLISVRHFKGLVWFRVFTLQRVG